MPASSPPLRKPRILFVAEAVTLAHVARPVALARALDPQSFSVHLAHHPRYRKLLGELPVSEHEIQSISPQRFTEALAAGIPLYDRATLKAYVEEDLQLITAVQPDVIVGDFRLSLGVSAALAAVPYVALANAYWSPYCRQRFVVPDLPMTRTLGVTLGQGLFTLARPAAFAMHCLPMHGLRRSYGLPSLGFDLRDVYTHGDYTCYADIPELYRMQHLPAHHRFIGPVAWSPELPWPEWWQSLPQDAPFVYVTLGSSGRVDLLPELIAALGALDVTALVSTAGAPLPPNAPGNVYLAPYLPGEAAVKMSSLVICNGGSPGTHQALLHGVPVIGITGNLDQFLNMAAIESSGAGRALRASRCDRVALLASIQSVLGEPAYRDAARDLSRRLALYDYSDEFNRLIKEICINFELGK
ncbi:MAG: glycosyltransferase [Halioglobus sp.]